MTGDVPLGRLSKFGDLRSVWPDEARDFTPWMAKEDNPALLSEFLGLGRDGLELEAVERLVGPYRADILCRSTETGQWVLIENQLERSDHSHLGQLIVYAAGLDAGIVVWVCREVTAEHQAAVEWLNDISGEAVSFFAVEIELWRIAGSPLAPRFSAIARPNTWTREAQAAKRTLSDRGLSETKHKQLEYWAALQTLVAAADGPLRPRKPQPLAYIMHGIGRTGVLLCFVMNTQAKWIRAEIYLKGADADERFNLLSEQRGDIEAETGPLDWQELPERTDCRIATPIRECDPSDQEDWPDQHRWLIDRASRLYRVFRPRVAALP